MAVWIDLCWTVVLYIDSAQLYHGIYNCICTCTNLKNVATAATGSRVKLVSCVFFSRKQRDFLHILQVYTHLHVDFLTVKEFTHFVQF